ncbi:hypothetical protein C8Q72DRAFT_446873 [Fomitopsis betulina]|nr:hypothetical protein C8Q72DRAFT_446873 [Fomitopsis betulina]
MASKPQPAKTTAKHTATAKKNTSTAKTTAKTTTTRKPPTTKTKNLQTATHTPFIALVDSISKCIPEARRNEVAWDAYHDRTHLPFENCVSEVGPHIAATLGDGVGLAKEKKKERQLQVPWSRILVPIAIKKRYHRRNCRTTDYPALLMLLKYIRIEEAMGRSFVIGIVVAHASVATYVADRTGVLGSEVIDIHKNPRDFIRVVVGISTMSPAQLGWDTSMTLIQARDQYTKESLVRWTPKLSYQTPLNSKEAYYWVVDMPKPKEGAESGASSRSASGASSYVTSWFVLMFAQAFILKDQGTDLPCRRHLRRVHASPSRDGGAHPRPSL